MNNWDVVIPIFVFHVPTMLVLPFEKRYSFAWSTSCGSLSPSANKESFFALRNLLFPSPSCDRITCSTLYGSLYFECCSGHFCRV